MVLAEHVLGYLSRHSPKSKWGASPQPFDLPAEAVRGPLHPLRGRKAVQNLEFVVARPVSPVPVKESDEGACHPAGSSDGEGCRFSFFG